MDLMRRWIQAEHNVWNVLNEIKQPPARSAAERAEFGPATGTRRSPRHDGCRPKP
jgi:hypothetical protein